MKRYLFCEYKKTRRKYIFVMAVAITAVALCWGLYGKYNESALKSGWMMMLYQLPLLSTIFMPVKIMPANMANTTMKSSENAIEITEINLL